MSKEPKLQDNNQLELFEGACLSSVCSSECSFLAFIRRSRRKYRISDLGKSFGSFDVRPTSDGRTPPNTFAAHENHRAVPEIEEPFGGQSSYKSPIPTTAGAVKPPLAGIKFLHPRCLIQEKDLTSAIHLKKIHRGGGQCRKINMRMCRGTPQSPFVIACLVQAILSKLASIFLGPTFAS